MSEERQAASVEYIEAENDQGYDQDCVEVECDDSLDTARAWGHGDDSVKCALAKLTETCSCGAKWHYDNTEDDENAEENEPLDDDWDDEEEEIDDEE